MRAQKWAVPNAGRARIGCGRVAKLADALPSGGSGRKVMEVQVLSRPPKLTLSELTA